MRSPRLLALAVLAACGSGTPAGDGARLPGDGARPPTAPDPARRIAGTGGLSEAEFAAMHQLRGDASPAPRGEPIDLAGGRAYLSLPPAATAPVPGIVVIHEWWGLNDHIRHWADRLAGLGFAALAVDLYGGVVATDADAARTAMQAVDADAARRTLEAALELLATDPRVRAPRRGVIGWCFGGGWALQTAIDQPVDAAVVYYGQPDLDPARLGAIRGRVLGVFADRDRGIPPATVDALEAALRQAKVDATVLRFDAEHAFANPSSPRYDQPDAEAAWRAVTTFLDDALRPR